MAADFVSSGDIPVNVTRNGVQGYASIAPLDAGRFIVAWESENLDGSGNGIGARVVGATGAPAEDEFPVNTTVALAQDGVRVAPVAGGGFVAVWESDGQDGDGKGIVARLYDAGGVGGSEFQVNVYTTLGQDDASVATDAAGNIVVVWESIGQDGNLGGIFGRRFNSSGTALGGEFAVNTFTTGPQVDAAVASDAVGNFVVVWGAVGQDGSAAGVFGQRFSSAGTKLGPEFQVNTFIAGSQDEPTVAADAAGAFVVLWESFGQDGSSNGIFGQLYASGGAPNGTEFQVNTYTTYSQDDVSAAFDPSTGDFLVVWESVNQDGGLLGGNGVFARRFDSSAVAAEAEFQVNTYTTGSQDDGVVAFDADGNFVVGWTSYEQDGSLDGVFARSFFAPACAVSPDPGCKLGAAGGSKLQVKDALLAKSDKLKWKQGKGDASALADFLDPVGSSAATIRYCLYDSSAAVQPLVEADIPPQRICGKKPCWKVAGTSGLKYKDKLGSPNGVTGAKFKAGVAGKSQVSISAKGVNLDMPVLPLAFPVTAQLIVTDGVTTNCWQSTFSTFTKNDATQVKSKGP